MKNLKTLRERTKTAKLSVPLAAEETASKRSKESGAISFQERH